MDPRGRQTGVLEASGGLLGPRPAQVAAQAAPEPPLGSSWSALGASWGRLGVPGRSPEDRREALLGGIFGGLPPRLKN